MKLIVIVSLYVCRSAHHFILSQTEWSMSLHFSLLHSGLTYFTHISFPSYQNVHSILYWLSLLRCYLVMKFIAKFYTVKLFKQHKRKFWYITKATRIQKLSYKIWAIWLFFIGILELSVNSGIGMMVLRLVWWTS